MSATMTRLRFWLIALLAVVWILSTTACGGGGTIVIGGSGDSGGDAASEDGEQQLSLIGSSVLSAQTKSYEVLISVGEALDVPVTASASGAYQIRSSLNF